MTNKSLTDIRNKEDVKVFVDAFYQKVRIDALLGPVFAAKIKKEDDWPKHLARMYSFWNTVLFSQVDYSGNPFSKHAELAIHSPHFERWVSLLKATIKEHFSGEKADEVLKRAQKMSLLFQAKLAYLRSNDQFHNLM